MTQEQPRQGMMIMFVMAAGFVLVALAIMFAPQPEVKVTTSGGTGPTQTNTISVGGQAELTVSPDQAEIYVRIMTEEPTAKRAQEENARLTNTVRDALKKTYSLEDDQIESSSYNLWPQQKYNPDTRQYEDNGYQVQHVLKVTTGKLEDIGNMLDTAVQNGANGIDTISFTLSDEMEKDVRDQALARAADNAREKAVSLTQTLGVKLGKVSSISESNYYYQPYNYAPRAAMDVAEGASYTKSTTISPQDVNVNANLNVAYEIE